jgi:hypothetical protein
MLMVRTNATIELPPGNTSRYPSGGGWAKTSGNSYTFNPDLAVGSTSYGWRAGDNGHWNQTGNTTWSGNEWPASGCFDKRQADASGGNTGWHSWEGNGAMFPYNSNGTVYAYVYCTWPVKGYMYYYTVQLRSACCPEQAPSAWTLYTGGTLLHNVANERNWSQGSTRGYYPTNSPLSDGCSFNIFAANGTGGNYCHISELRVYIYYDNDSSGYTNYYGTSLYTLGNWARRQLGLGGGTQTSMSQLCSRAGVPAASPGNNISLVGTVVPLYWNS